MKRAVEALQVQPQWVLVDGNRMPSLKIPGEAVVKGDAQCASIAAASVLAKASAVTGCCGNGISNIPHMALESTKDMGQRPIMRRFPSTVCCPSTGAAF